MTKTKNTITIEIISATQTLTEDDLTELRADYAALGETEFNLKHNPAGIKAKFLTGRTTVYGH